MALWSKWSRSSRRTWRICTPPSFWCCPWLGEVIQYTHFYTPPPSPPRTKFRGVYRNHSVRLSVRLSVQIRVRPITFLWFDIGLPYLAHGCITIRRCVAYIHDPDTTLNFDLKVKFIGFLTCFPVRPITFFWFDIGLPYLAHGCITIRRCVV